MGESGTTRAAETIRRCRLLAGCSEEAGATTRTFLSPPMRDVHAHVGGWMRDAGMAVTIDAAGNIRGLHPGEHPSARRLFIGSHLDTVPNAGAFDGVLGVMIGIALVESLAARRLPYAIEVVGFSEEEGVRFGMPFIGSRALAGTLDDAALARCDRNGETIADAVRAFGLDVGRLAEARATPDAVGYLEFHIEQGPVLESRGRSIAVVDRIAGQTRVALTFAGAANHAGTTPMGVRHDALAGTSEWIVAVEAAAAATPDLVATVGRIDVRPNATNVIAGRCDASLDVRHRDDGVRQRSAATFVALATGIAGRRGLSAAHEVRLDQPVVVMDEGLTDVLEQAVRDSGAPLEHLASGAGHDAMVVAACMPAAMLFLRSPGGVSHHPDETVLEDDVALALRVGGHFLARLAERQP